uniref:Uncharacterized protein n=1 Tax=Rhizophora mucronata TaxID=61149 RepID=A0A2P2QNH6_RHIMU
MSPKPTDILLGSSRIQEERTSFSSCAFSFLICSRLLELGNGWLGAEREREDL